MKGEIVAVDVKEEMSAWDRFKKGRRVIEKWGYD